MIASLARCIRKEFQLEWRGGEVLFPCVLLGLVASCVTGLTITSLNFTQETIQQLFFPLAWVLFFLTGSVGSGRLFEHEWRSNVFVQLELLRVPWWHTYLGKVVFAISTYLLLASTIFVSLSILLHLPITFSLLHLVFLAMTVCITFSAVTALLSAITVFSVLRSILLPLLTLPLVIPLLFAAIELSLDLQTRGIVDFTSPWLSLVLGLGLFFLLAGINLIEHVVRE